jgi:acetyl esterase/lipase
MHGVHIDDAQYPINGRLTWATKTRFLYPSIRTIPMHTVRRLMGAARDDTAQHPRRPSMGTTHLGNLGLSPGSGLMRLTMSVGIVLAGFLTTPTVAAQGSSVETRKAVQYGTHDGATLIGDLYLPEGGTIRPAIIAVHGGGYQLGSRDLYRYLGPHLAANGYAVFSIDYRLMRDEKNRYPAAVNDTRAAVQWVRSRAAELKIDPARIALMGDSAGAHLSALVALAGDSPDYENAYPDDPYANVSTKVRAVIGVYGVDPKQSEAFLTALKQARFYVRAVVVQSAPHFWISDPIEEPNSFTGFFVPRLLRFLAQRL